MKKHFIPLVILSLITAMLFTSCSNENSPSASSQILQSALASETAGALNTSSSSGSPQNQTGAVQASPGVMLVDFEKENEGLEFFDLSLYNFTTPPVLFEEGESVQSGKGLCLDINYTPAHGVISMQIQNQAGDITQGFSQAQNYGYLRFWVNNQGDSDVSIAVVLVIDEPLKNGCLDPEGARIISSSGEEEQVFTSDAADVNNTNGTGNTSLDIPSGFTGWVYYPLEQQVPWWEGTTLAQDELKNVTTISLDIRFTDASLTDCIIIDDISLADPET